MRALVAGGADPKIKAEDGATVLMAAANSGHVNIVKYAYELSPDLTAITERKATVMHAAVSGFGSMATQAQICEVIQFLADKGAELDGMDANGRTPLMIADILPIDKAVNLLTKLILQTGNTPKIPSKR
jgi:ankyrin repeat protein